MWEEQRTMADILLQSGEVVWDGDEICIVKKEDAIGQEAYLRASCDLGESIFYDGYGSKLFTYLGKPDSQTNRALMETEIKESLLKTDGITEVLSVSFRYGQVENQTYPFIYARYRCAGKETPLESIWKFSV